MANQINNEELNSLLKKAQNGESGAFQMIYEEFFTPVFRYIFLRVKSKAEAEDLTQTVFLRAFESLGNFRLRGRPLLAYFFTIARNAVIDYWRKNKRELSLEDRETEFRNLPGQSVDPIQKLDDKKNLEAIRQALHHLTEDQQEVIVMKFLSDLPNSEIARLTGKSEEAVRQLQCRGLKALRKHLKP